MKLNFLKYSVYVLIAILNVANSLCAMDDDEPTTGETESSGLRRTHTIKRPRSNTVVGDPVDQQPWSIDAIAGGTSVTRTPSGDQKVDESITTATSLIQRLDSQGIYNQEFDPQVINDTKVRYEKTLAETQPDVVTGNQEGNASKKAKKTHFKPDVSVRACKNVVEAEFVVNGTKVIVEKTIPSYRKSLEEKAKRDKEKKVEEAEEEKKTDEKEKKWKTIPEIKDHPIFKHKFYRKLNAVRIGLKKLREAKLLTIEDDSSEDDFSEDDSLTKVFREFDMWEKCHLHPRQIWLGLVKKLENLGVTTQADIAQLEEAMNQEYTRHTDALNTERARLIAADVFDLPAQCSMAVASEYSDSSYPGASTAVSNGATSDGATSGDIERSVLDDDISSDAGSVSSVLHFGDKTDLQYFDWLVERYGQALTTFKDDLIRLKDLEAEAVMITS